jgi:4-hydroxymandelate oxidase
MRPSVGGSPSARPGTVLQPPPGASPDEPASNVNDLASLLDFEAAAQRHISHAVWEYYAGAADEITLRWNREAYDRLRLRPRVLVDVSKIDTRTRLLGQDLAHPILLAPAADHCMVHRDGEMATARGAGSTDTILVLSSFSNTCLEDVAGQASAPLWFQLYVQRDREFTRDVVQRAEAAGYQALCVTVDTPTFGPRNRQARARYELAPGLSRPHLPPGQDASGTAASQVFPDWTEPALTWRDIDWLSSIVKMPILLKGVLNPDDAERAIQEGVAGVIVSNHGARNLDTVPATADALPLVVEKVEARIPVLVDGGIRRGTDIVKALAMGASAVLIGRPYLYGLAVGGEGGVRRVIEILRTELEMAMGLVGRPTIRDIDRSVLWD